jgi:hypothetical protein
MHLLNLLSAYTASLYSAAAYCRYENIADWKCGRVCSDPLTVDTRVVTLFTASPTTTRYADGFIAVNDRHEQIIVSFRGSLSLLNWISNLRVWQETVPWGQAGSVHSGFLSVYKKMASVVQSGLLEQQLLHPHYSVLFTGHSLGGALASLAAVDQAVNTTRRVSLITFGQPRVGNLEWSQFVNTTLSGTLQRWVNKADLVPHLPLYSLRFVHHPREYWVGVDGRVVECSVEDGEDGSCSDSLLIANSVIDHLSIFDVLFGPFC